MASTSIQNFGINKQQQEKLIYNNNNNKIEIKSEELNEKNKIEIINVELLEENLIKCLEELKQICIEEAELIGHLPKEIYKTLLPGEKEPLIKKRIGTSFKYPNKLLNNNNNKIIDDNDELGKLEKEIVLNKRIVAAAERLATDWSANKGLRRKRRRDLQTATLKLKTLERDLNRKLRLSNSKPDISSTSQEEIQGMQHRNNKNVGSGFSLNSLKNWPNFYNTIRRSNNNNNINSSKSCPSTPHGSIIDLNEITLNNKQKEKKKLKKTPTDAKNIHNNNILIKNEEKQKQLLLNNSKQQINNCSSSPIKLTLSFSSSSSSSTSSYSSSSLSLNGPQTSSIKNQKNNGTFSATISSSSGISSTNMSTSLVSATSSTNLITPPPIPYRRSSIGNNNLSNKLIKQQSKEILNSEEINKSITTHLLYANIGYTSSVPYKSAYRQSNFPTLLNNQKRLSINNYCSNNNNLITKSISDNQKTQQLFNSSISSSVLPRFHKISPQQSCLFPSYYSSSSLDRRGLKKRNNWKNQSTEFQINNKQQPLRLQQKPSLSFYNYPSFEIIEQFSLQRKTSATTFPVDTKLNPFESTENSQQNNSFNINQILEKDERMENLLALIHNTTINTD
ncbi:DUF3338 domain-containing protein [Meloidogyne graminicola]|uniref:DUF3338 domain-containing protein n=1 Tax=Meloidogyne graminicola TaxID=189291 RepID=A0A8S9ZR04_9BILA|nr:DUF3338 domain-containing protein [Meloidogyne graminicola]